MGFVLFKDLSMPEAKWWVGRGDLLRRLPTLTGVTRTPISEDVPRMALGSAWSSTWSSSLWQSGKFGSAASDRASVT